MCGPAVKINNDMSLKNPTNNKLLTWKSEND